MQASSKYCSGSYSSVASTARGRSQAMQITVAGGLEASISLMLLASRAGSIHYSGCTFACRGRRCQSRRWGRDDGGDPMAARLSWLGVLIALTALAGCGAARDPAP